MNPRAATCVNMRTVSTMALDLQMFDSEDVASVVDLDVDTTGERSSRSSGERCEPVGKGKKAGKARRKATARVKAWRRFKFVKAARRKPLPRQNKCALR